MMEARPIDTDLFQKFLDINILKMWGSKNIASWIHIENKKDLVNKKVFQMWELGFLQMSQKSKLITFAFIHSVSLFFYFDSSKTRC